jgi:hypothetical protein
MIMFVPLIIIPVGYFKRLDCQTVDEIIAEQYGIKVERDGTYVKLDNFNDGQPMENYDDAKAEAKDEAKPVNNEVELNKLDKVGDHNDA